MIGWKAAAAEGDEKMLRYNHFRNGVVNNLSYLLEIYHQQIGLNEPITGGRIHLNISTLPFHEYQGHTVKNNPAPQPTNRDPNYDEKIVWIRERERETNAQTWIRESERDSTSREDDPQYPTVRKLTIHEHTINQYIISIAINLLPRIRCQPRGNSLKNHRHRTNTSATNPKFMSRIVSSNCGRHNQQVNTWGIFGI